MKQKRITVQICELCENPIRNGLSYKCSVCKKEICSNCEKSESFQHRADICWNCKNNEKASEILRRYDKKHWKLVYDEQRALATIKPKKVTNAR